ncbi:CBS domain-containing protein [Streptomyces sp. NBC_01685]|uniref:restriction system modified-DNA reader domain-containing protein n=1 Tax=Streptomyces sp. NBC_01685 TaxID=2975910 RepID=UPI002E365918|nr:CBS domain-containing protein [Streptomyces sp. NBC_01685]
MSVTGTEAGTSVHPYLLDGRRVRIADLVHAGLIVPGDALTFHRPRKGETYHAEVTSEEGGGIRLAGGTRVFRSPSQAADAAVGSGSFDGWETWKMDDGRDLDEIRQVLLDQAADRVLPEQAMPQDEAAPGLSSAQRHQRLKDARVRADGGKPLSLSVRKLLSWWGSTGRGTVRDQIEADLANHGLTTSPNFEQVTLDVTIELRRVPAESDTAASSEAEQPEAGRREPGPTVGTIDSAMGGVCSIKKEDGLDKAVTLMMLNDYSQMPVMSGSRQVVGVVTWQSLAQAWHIDRSCTLAQALVEPQMVRYDHDLVDVLRMLIDCDFVLVRGPKKDIVGIVTLSDLAYDYGEITKPFLLVGELDRRLRSVITDRFDLDDVIPVCDRSGERRLTSLNSLTFGDYVSILRSKECWAKLGWPLDRAEFTRRLDTIRKIRNDLMHFNPDPLPSNAEQQIRSAIRLVRTYAS